jgi:hypothetical protein
MHKANQRIREAEEASVAMWEGLMSRNRTKGSRSRSASNRSIMNRSNSERPRFSSRALAWGGGLLTAAVSALITAVLVGLPAEVRDVPAVKDRVRDVARGDKPLRIDVVSTHHDEAFSMVFPGDYEPTPDQKQQLTENLTKETAAAAEQEFDKDGAASLGQELLQLQVEGRRNQQVTIVDIHPKIIKRTSPLAGTLIDIPSEGELATRMGINFDERVPMPREVPEDGFFDDVDTWSGRYFEKFTINLNDRGSETLLIGLITLHHYIEFDLVFTYTLGGASRTETVDNNGQHFRITAPNCIEGTSFMSYRHAFANSANGRWGVGPVANPARVEDQRCAKA